MTLRKISSLTLSSGVGNDGLISAVFNSSTGYIYFGTNVAPGNIVEVNTSNFTESNFISLSGGEDSLKSASIDIANGLAYFCTNVSPGPAVVVKVQLTPLARIDSVTGGATQRRYTASDIDTTNNFLYVASSFGGGVDKLQKYNLSPFSFVSELNLDSCINSISIDKDKTYIYHAGTSSPASLTKVRLSDFTTFDSLSLGVFRSSVSIIDKKNGFLYSGSAPFGTPNGVVKKIRLSDFTVIDSITIDTDKLVSAIIDTDNNLLYIGTNASPGKIHQIDLNTFTKINTITLDTGENDLESAVIDTNNKIGYFGTNTAPGIVVKLDLSQQVTTSQKKQILGNISKLGYAKKGAFINRASGKGISFT